MKKYILLISCSFLLSNAYSQLEYGIKAGIGHGIYTIYHMGINSPESIWGTGWTVGGMISYRYKKHRFEIQPSLFDIVSPYNDPFLPPVSFHTEEEFVFLEFPIVYSYEVLKNLHIGTGITNSILIATTINIADEFGRKPYFLGALGELEYSITDHISFAASYRRIGLLQTKDLYRVYSSYAFEARWRF